MSGLAGGEGSRFMLLRQQVGAHLQAKERHERSSCDLGRGDAAAPLECPASRDLLGLHLREGFGATAAAKHGGGYGAHAAGVPKPGAGGEPQLGI